MTKNLYRIWYGIPEWMFEDFQALTAADALTIATLNFKRTDLKPIKMEWLKEVK